MTYGFGERQHYIVTDLGFGDAGKGATVDRLCTMQPVHTVVRHSGGCQAGHNVVLADGRSHTFSQFGAGTFRGARTLLSRFMMVEPLSMCVEAEALKRAGVPDPMDLMTVEGMALLTTPYHWIVQRHQAEAGFTCARGIAQTRLYDENFPGQAPVAYDLLNRASLRKKLTRLEDWAHEQTNGQVELPSVPFLMEEYWTLPRFTITDQTYLDDLLVCENVVFEGSQGVLLDEDYGFPPYNTWTRTTDENAWQLLEDARDTTGLAIEATSLGVLRTYQVRHGGGPMPTEHELELPEPHNKVGQWQGHVRHGHFDAVLAHYAAMACKLDRLVLTHVDVAEREDLRMVTRYQLDGKDYAPRTTSIVRDRSAARITAEQDGENLFRVDYALGGPVTDWVGQVSDLLGLEVWMVGRGPTAEDYSLTEFAFEE